MTIEYIKKIFITYLKEVEYNFETYKNMTINKNIKELLLSSEDMGKNKLEKLKKRFYYEFNLKKTNTHKYYEILNCILLNVEIEQFIVDISKEYTWKMIIFKVLDEIDLEEQTINSHEDRLDLRLVKSIKYLKSRGYEYEFKKEYPMLTEEYYLKVGIEIDNKIKALGGLHVLRYIIKFLKDRCFNKGLDMYMINRRRPDLSEKNIKIQEPIGYLINVAVKHLNAKNFSHEIIEKDFLDILELSSEYVFTLRIQNVNYFKDMFVKKEELGEFIQKNILFDNIIKFRQYNCKYILEIVDGILRDLWNENILNYKFDTIISFIKLVLEVDNHLKYLNIDKISNRLKVNRKEVLSIIDILSIKENKVNKDFFIPNGIKNFHQTPIIKTKKGYLLIDKHMASFSFFEIICNLMRERISNFDYELGTKFEDFIKKLLAKKDIDFYSGYYKTQEECDLILENNNYIVFIEIKKKFLTNKALQGIDINFMNDINKSLIDSQIQSGKHQLNLLKDKEICLYDKRGKKNRKIIKKIKLNNRKIKRVSLVLQDYNCINSYTISRQILVGLTNTIVNSEVEEYKTTIEMLNKNIQKLNHQYQELIKLNSSYDNIWSIYENVHFFNLQQFMYILEESNDKDDLFKRLFMLEKFFTGTHDFFSDYENMKKVLSE
ncbi:hypothetical protein [Tepidibacter hydrothermalis]|uniref:NERD domain-containing protein n=1 Tax=Tepidibacter hydrothermalis TaxID=3036126 RepID=A0ABY8EB66_9FIRM|nr:hypothetical protein [Tepidibacter hydrothermalis]WFD08757.1 hypothetical protein P4S50_10140 [Tepidibacter hydrothermalis]